MIDLAQQILIDEIEHLINLGVGSYCPVSKQEEYTASRREIFRIISETPQEKMVQLLTHGKDATISLMYWAAQGNDAAFLTEVAKRLTNQEIETILTSKNAPNGSSVIERATQYNRVNFLKVALNLLEPEARYKALTELKNSKGIDHYADDLQARVQLFNQMLIQTRDELRKMQTGGVTTHLDSPLSKEFTKGGSLNLVQPPSLSVQAGHVFTVQELASKGTDINFGLQETGLRIKI